MCAKLEVDLSLVADSRHSQLIGGCKAWRKAKVPLQQWSCNPPRQQQRSGPDTVCAPGGTAYEQAHFNSLISSAHIRSVDRVKIVPPVFFSSKDIDHDDVFVRHLSNTEMDIKEHVFLRLAERLGIVVNDPANAGRP